MTTLVYNNRYYNLDHYICISELKTLLKRIVADDQSNNGKSHRYHFRFTITFVGGIVLSFEESCYIKDYDHAKEFINSMFESINKALGSKSGLNTIIHCNLPKYD